MSILDTKSMTPSQRLLAMEELWESLCQQDTELASPEWHEDILAERRSKLAAGEVGFLTLAQLRERLGR